MEQEELHGVFRMFYYIGTTYYVEDNCYKLEVNQIPISLDYRNFGPHIHQNESHNHYSLEHAG